MAAKALKIPRAPKIFNRENLACTISDKLAAISPDPRQVRSVCPADLARRRLRGGDLRTYICRPDQYRAARNINDIGGYPILRPTKRSSGQRLSVFAGCDWHSRQTAPLCRAGNLRYAGSPGELWRFDGTESDRFTGIVAQRINRCPRGAALQSRPSAQWQSCAKLVCMLCAILDIFILPLP